MRRHGLRIMGQLLVLAGPLLPVLLITIVTGVLGFVCAIGIIVFGALALLTATGITTGYTMSFLLTAIVVCAVLRGVFRYGEQMSGHYLAFKLLAVLRDKVLQALRRLAPAKLEGKDKGNLISLITSDIELLEVFYAHTIAPVMIGIITSLLMVFFIGSYEPLLGWLAALAYLTVGLFIPLLTSRMGKRQGMEYRSSFGKLSSYFLDSLRGMKEIVQYGQGEQRLNEINRRTDQLDAKQKDLKHHEGITRAITDAAVVGFSFLMLLAGLYGMSNGHVDFTGMLISVIALFSSFGPVVALSNLSNNLLQTLASGERVLSLLEETPEVEENIEGMSVAFTGAQVDKVTFAYDGQTVLNDVSLTIPHKRILGIQGKSGSGKSTLLKLMMRFRDPQQGGILLSGHDLKEIGTRHLRGLQSYVDQHTFLFDDSIATNIKIGKPDATHEQVVEAARKASVHDFIMTLPQGYDSRVGELGDRLSGGERQRLGLARAFVHNAPLLLLDEPTSNLDSLNEAIILKSLKEQQQDKTVVLVSHRSSTMRIADDIFEMDNRRLS
ncbi:thiol reductant ABC exporter CydC subunit [Paenibacillus sp. PvR133]|uniref:amino acid ABC transporter ATP-binding/permease protein n=1 Tax=Paenibacillus sp. PvR133 TaxID=2806598 RepID=UPI001AE8B314|nr:ABC transporter ATP-binding protein [Paenibacillus sp. PvR133]MBP1177745.1 thiol reductant ABC exporter CydC subunit [Paenibacillus sp. PvR133]